MAVNQMPDRRGWLEFSRPVLRLRLRYPAVTPRGRPVEITEEEHEYERHRAYLVGQFGPEAVSELTPSTLGGWPAFTYAFRGNGLERAVLSLQVGRDTYRVISDPRARLNHDIIATLTIEE